MHLSPTLFLSGGLEAQQKLNQEKAKVLYDAIAASNGFYVNPVEPSVRSLMNVPFTIPSNPELEKAFVKETEKLGMVGSQLLLLLSCDVLDPLEC